jgi:CheY-like chemotaxis protein
MRTSTNRAEAVPRGLRAAAFRDLCDAYDPLLRPGATADAGARETLEAFARLFDLRVEPVMSEAVLWRQVRPLLAGQLGADAPAVDAGLAAAAKVFLPRAPATGTGLADAGAPLALLVAEDDPDLSAGIVETLGEAGHLVVAAAATARDAATLAAHHAIDFAVVDVELEGGGDGVALAQQLHDRWGLKSLFISGGPNARLVELDLALGFLGKPFSAAELLAAVTLASGLVRRRVA